MKVKTKNKTPQGVKPLITVVEFFVAGVKYYDYQKVNPRAGELVTLTWEPSNPYDRNAIRVDIDGYKIGYVPRDLAHKLHWERLAGRKVEARVRAYNRNNPTWDAIRVTVKTNKDDDGNETRLTQD